MPSSRDIWKIETDDARISINANLQVVRPDRNAFKHEFR